MSGQLVLSFAPGFTQEDYAKRQATLRRQHAASQRWAPNMRYLGPAARCKAMLAAAKAHEKAAARRIPSDHTDAETHLEYARQYRRNAQ